MSNWSISAVSEDTQLIEWSLNVDQSISAKLTARIRAITLHLLEHHADKVINVTPAYLTLLIQFDLVKVDQQQIIKIITESIEQDLMLAFEPGKLHQIPVFYDASVAADLEQICIIKEVTPKQLIELHTSVIYDVYAIGFLPGFAYLGHLPEQLNVPRHKSFRGQVPAGSVALADRQTAIYPSVSPGGWQVIGRTTKQLLDGCQSTLQTGDRVQFCSISRDEFLAQGGVL